jgi:glycosyltransferase involved in cell wall biosynthesis
MRRILLVEPIFHVHSLVQFRAALRSEGFEDAHFTLLVGGIAERDRERVSNFERDEERVELRELPGRAKPLLGRLECWKAWGKAVFATEEILRRESFDFFAYLMFDNALPCFAWPGAQLRLRAHFAAGVRGLIFRDNGFRPGATPSFKEKLRAAIDRLIFDRAVRSGAIRKLAFYDHHCADLARDCYGDVCGYGVDPVEAQPRDPGSARRKLNLPADAFVALMFGVISARKGVVETLHILAREKIAGTRFVVLLAGPVEPDLRPALEIAVEEARHRFPVIWFDSFVPDADMPDYFAAADCIICAYKGFNASSSVLVHGASHGKPAIVSRGGVMHDAVSRFKFGEAVSLEDPAGFAAALHLLMNLPDSERKQLREGALEYARSMDARRYMSQFT